MAVQAAQPAPAKPPTGGEVPIVESGPTDNASLAAELEAMGGEAPEEAPAPAPEPEKPAEEPAPEPEPDEDAPTPPPKIQEPPEEVDKVTAKRLEAIKKAESASKAAMAKEREALEKDRADLKARTESLEKIEGLLKRFKYDPMAFMRAVDLGEDDYEPIARVIYEHSKAAQSDPARRASAMKTLREREQGDDFAQLRREFIEFKEQVAAEKRQASEEQRFNEYLDKATKAAGDDTPVIKNLLSKNAAKARQRIGEMARLLYKETGEEPDAADVLAALEKAERDELADRGIDVDTFIGKKPAAPAKKPAPTLAADLAAPTAPKAGKPLPRSRKEERDELVRELEQASRENRL